MNNYNKSESFEEVIKSKQIQLKAFVNDPITNEKIKYVIKNNETLGRAKTLFTKEKITIEWIRSFQSNSVFFDIGANVGMYSIYATTLDRSLKVFSFEPESNNFQTLIENIITNNFSDNINAFPIAIGDKSGFTDLYLNSFSAGRSHHMIDQMLDHNLKNKSFMLKQGVFKTSLDDLIFKWKFPMPDYIKIDVDGIENQIIKNSKKTLKNKKLKSLLIEINQNREEDREIINILNKLNFKYDQSQVNQATRPSGPHKGYAEYLFTRN